MYYVETRAENSGYTNHRVIGLVVIGSSFDSEQVFQLSNGYLYGEKNNPEASKSSFLVRLFEEKKSSYCRHSGVRVNVSVWAG
jgi:hypothetical protein